MFAGRNIFRTNRVPSMLHGKGLTPFAGSTISLRAMSVTGADKDDKNTFNTKRGVYAATTIAAIGGLAYAAYKLYNEKYDPIQFDWARNQLGLSDEKTKIVSPISKKEVEIGIGSLISDSKASCAGKEDYKEEESAADTTFFRKMDKEEELIATANYDLEKALTEVKSRDMEAIEVALKAKGITSGVVEDLDALEKKLNEMREYYESELMKVLARQSQVHHDTLELSKDLMRQDFERRLKQNTDISESEHLVELRIKFTKAASALAAMRQVLSDRQEQDGKSEELRKLWTYCSSLYNQINFADRFRNSKDSTISINKEKLLAEFSGDAFAHQLIKTIPDSVGNIDCLRDRFFSKIDKTCRNVGVFRDGNNVSLGKYMWGYLQGTLTTRCEGDKESPSTIYEILDKTAYHLRRGELLEAVLTLNNTNGPARIICQDWLADACEVLETSQTLFALMTHVNVQSSCTV